MREVAVVGLGYVGLTMAACLAARGIRTTGVDVDKEKLAMVERRTSPFYEPGLQDMLSESLRSGHLALTADCEEAVGRSELVFVTVGTPSNPDGSINLDQIKAACTNVGSALRKSPRYHLTVIRSTVTPGTTENVVKPLLESASGKTCGSDFGLCVNPEFVSEGRAVDGTMNPGRIIIGEWDSQAGDILERFYAGFCDGKTPPVLRTTFANAELIKYANNAFLATKVSFINSLANLCERIPGADIELIAKGIGLDPRIGPLFLRAGLGWGGTCFPKDLRALVEFARVKGEGLPVIRSAYDVNESQPLRAVQIAGHLIGSLRGKRIAVLGVSFKPETDDIREASGLVVIHGLLREGAEVTVYDPKAMQNARNVLGEKVRYAQSALECIEGADCCIVATEWDEFRKLTAEDFAKRMRAPCVVDGRRIYDPNLFKSKVRFAAIGLA
jgi:UDPglucose 6-dehydrogenase